MARKVARQTLGVPEIVALGSLTGVSANGDTTTELLMQVFAGVFANRHLEIGGVLTGNKLGDFDMLGSAGAVGIVNFPNNSRDCRSSAAVSARDLGIPILLGIRGTSTSTVAFES